ncbi:unnamed protein product [Ranitomeya imitator]|uniref:Uncharacterized protein n=1 Tax=Ranitomeya imitator TaxID=111125 RepID=A0ABN9M320_9NEOB|nr:unnamed protein product [Ranitomeya imitator]
MALLLRGSVLFAALLMLVSALPGELRGKRSPATASEYGVKLCGREFYQGGHLRLWRVPVEAAAAGGWDEPRVPKYRYFTGLCKPRTTSVKDAVTFWISPGTASKAKHTIKTAATEEYFSFL